MFLKSHILKTRLIVILKRIFNLKKINRCLLNFRKYFLNFVKSFIVFLIKTLKGDLKKNIFRQNILIENILE